MSIKNKTVGIIGLGYVGLSLAYLSQKKFITYGFDIDSTKIKKLKNSSSYINDLNFKRNKFYLNKTFFPTNDLRKLELCDYLIICVPTPLKSDNKTPDLSFIKKTVNEIYKIDYKKKTIILESTSWPGTTKELIINKLNKKNLICGKDFFVCFSPERINPGDDYNQYFKTPKVVGADDKVSLKKGLIFYKKIFKKVVLASSSSVAEACKLYENIFRSINISFANELKYILRDLEIDIWEVIDICNTKPFGFMPFYPGAGIGGHCIPIDPLYLLWKLKKEKLSSNVIELTTNINESIPYIIVKIIKKEIKKKKLSILILGLSYKKNVNDLRESAALRIMNLFRKNRINFRYYDIFFNKIKLKNNSNIQNTSININKKNLLSFDGVLITTDHDNVDYDFIFKNSKIIFDTKNLVARKYKKFSYKTIKL